MKSLRLPLLLVIVLAGFLAPPANAAAGGSTLPFNDALTLITDNLTGPTANTIIVVIIIAGLITIGIGREEPWLKKMGGAVIICACLAKASTLPSVLGLGSATGDAFSFRVPSLALQTFGFLLLAAPLSCLFLRPRRSAE